MLFSSVHENNEKLEDQEWSPNRFRMAAEIAASPDHSTIYSSSHDPLIQKDLLKTNQKQTRTQQNFRDPKPSLIQESSETSESSEGSQTDALVSSKPKKKPASRGRSRNKSNQTEKAIKTKKRLRKTGLSSKLMQKRLPVVLVPKPKV